MWRHSRDGWTILRRGCKVYNGIFRVDRKKVPQAMEDAGLVALERGCGRRAVVTILER